MAKMQVRTGDNVVVLAGKDKGKVGAVVDAFPKTGKVTVQGVNVVSKHKKPRSAQDKGGITKIESSIDVSNVQVICPTCNKATRISHNKNEQGKNERICKKCGATIVVSTKKAKAAKPAAKAEKTTKSTAAKPKQEK